MESLLNFEFMNFEFMSLLILKKMSKNLMSYKTDLQTKSKGKRKKKDKKRKLMNILSLSNSICNSKSVYLM